MLDCPVIKQSMMLWYLRPQYTNDDGSQLLVLPSETPHVIQPGLKLTVSGTETPHHLQVLLSLPFHDVSQKHLELLILVFPRLEDFKTRHHHLQKTEAHDMSSTGRLLQKKSYHKS